MSNIFSYDQNVKYLHGSIALRYMYENRYDRAISLNSIYLTYAPSLRFNERKLLISPAIEIGWRRNHLYWHPSYPPLISHPLYQSFTDLRYLELGENIYNKFDINCGLLISHKNFVYGASVHHLTEPEMEWIYLKNFVLPRKYTMHLLYLWKINEKQKISPSIHVQQQGNNQFLKSKISYSYTNFLCAIGTSINRKLDYKTYNFYLGYQKNWYSIRYGYDMIVFKYENIQEYGSHELCLIAKFNCKNKEENRKGPELINF